MYIIINYYQSLCIIIMYYHININFNVNVMLMLMLIFALKMGRTGGEKRSEEARRKQTLIFLKSLN